MKASNTTVTLRPSPSSEPHHEPIVWMSQATPEEFNRTAMLLTIKYLRWAPTFLAPSIKCGSKVMFTYRNTAGAVRYGFWDETYTNAMVGYDEVEDMMVDATEYWKAQAS
jgi:hypothetical protein